MFLNVGDPGNENTHTENDLLTVIKKLNEQNKGLFLWIYAQVEQDKGFWKECGESYIIFSV